MFKSFFSFIFHFIVYTFAFLVAVWALLGIAPDEAYEKFRNQLSFYNRQIRSVSGTADKISGAASNQLQNASDQLQNASDRFYGKDPYEKINQQLSNSLK